MRVLVDSNVLLDIFTEDENWFTWSALQLEDRAERDILVVNPVIYAEIACHFSKIEDLESALPSGAYVREALPWEAAFLAGRCFVQYRRRGGDRPTPMPDFYIGAHAAVARMALLTRDPRRYRTYFPTVDLICPQ